MRDMLLFLIQDARRMYAGRMIAQLTAALKRESSLRARRNLALTLAELDVHSAQVVEPLAEMLQPGQRAPWFAAAAAIGLAKLGDQRGLEFIDSMLEDSPAAAYPVALMLAEAGRPSIARVVSNAPARTSEALIEKVDVVRALHAECKGNLVRVLEKLADQGLAVGTPH